MMAGPLAFAFAAGMVATVNPCGFAMLPAYLALFLTDRAEHDAPSGLRAGLRTGTVVTAAFVATFSAVGAVVNFVTTGIVNYIPWAALVVGIAVLVAGVVVLAGRHLPIRTLQLRFGKDGSTRSVALFGVAYAVASVSCTLPIFLAVTTAATTAGTVVQGIAVFAAYGLGMGIVLIALAVGVATSRDAIVRHARRIMPYVERVGGWLLVASGVSIIYYWTTLLTVGVTTDSARLGPVLFVERVSSWFTNQIASNSITWGAGLAAIVLFISVFEIRRKRKATNTTAIV